MSWRKKTRKKVAINMFVLSLSQQKKRNFSSFRSQSFPNFHIRFSSISSVQRWYFIFSDWIMFIICWHLRMENARGKSLISFSLSISWIISPQFQSISTMKFSWMTLFLLCYSIWTSSENLMRIQWKWFNDTTQEFGEKFLCAKKMSFASC